MQDEFVTSTSNSLVVLIVDDDAELRSYNQRYLEKKGYSVIAVDDGEGALEQAHRHHIDVAVLDLSLPGISGLQVLPQLKELAPDCEVVMLTGTGDIGSAVQAMKDGAFDFLVKPTVFSALETAVKKAGMHAKLRKENEQLRLVIERREPPPPTIIGNSPQLAEVLRLIARVGPTDKPVLIQGETGTGKELVARAVHKASPVAQKPLVTINCAALPENLLESELFGHEKGAFTGAIETKQGLFEAADGSSLFMDEMGEIPGPLQAKLLRVLEDGSFRRLGSVKERRVKVRLIAATNRDLAQAVKDGTFREDLYYRINVMCLELPPLRERTGDIRMLVEHFLGSDWSIDSDAMEALESCPWPGNIRQLMNVLERAKILAEEQEIYLEDLPQEMQDTKQKQTVADSDDISEVQRVVVRRILAEENGNKSQTARRLGINRRTLYRLLDKYGELED
ncbi:MAG: DNA-binding NtrC family response regulator [Pirellulaceae bacterium]